MMDVLNEKVLVVNKNFFALCVVNVKTAMKLIFSCKATVLDEQYVNYSLKDWENVNLAGKKILRTVNKAYAVPEVIRLVDFDQMISKTISLTKLNIFIRDDYKCQYCGSQEELTIDHIIPKSRAKEFKYDKVKLNSWENMVTCCRECNVRKDNKTIKEANLKLLQKPKCPNYLPNIDIKIMKKSWELFIQRNFSK